MIKIYTTLCETYFSSKFDRKKEVNQIFYNMYVPSNFVVRNFCKLLSCVDYIFSLRSLCLKTNTKPLKFYI